MTVSSIEVCDCRCHRMAGVQHSLACCHKCPHCHQNIITGQVFKEHVKNCQAEHEALVTQIEAYIRQTNGDVD